MTETLENPLLEGLKVRRTPDPCIFVIFGASGDLTQRKLIPALYSLAYRRLLPEKFAVVGVARTEESDDDFRARMEDAVKEHARDPFRDDVWERLVDGISYIATDFADEEGEDRLASRLSELDGSAGPRATASTTSPCRRPRSRRSSRSWASGAPRRAGRAS